MKILSHRGYWESTPEKNSVSAFQRSFSLGFGTETDIRDSLGRLVISHDVAKHDSMPFREFLEIFMQHHKNLPLALNVKADGLAGLLKDELLGHEGLDAFVFDMSVPDMRAYFQLGIPVFTRVSEVEEKPAWLSLSVGVWLDAFESDWYDISLIEDFLEQGKRVCLVSPELHGRPHEAVWERLHRLQKAPRLMLCTDYPERARSFFEPA